MNQPRYCPACGVVLPDNRLAGLCPACAWKGISDSGDEAPASDRAGVLMRLPGYEILKEIARGGMGIVYRARQLDPLRTVALKMVLPHQLGSPEAAARFRLEIRALTELEHPSILPVYQVGEHDRFPFFTMKLATGGTLAQRKEEFAGDWRGIAGLMSMLADAVHFAHEHGVLHRDLKPGNVLFDDAGRAYVSDFGLAKLAGTDSDLTRSADFLGTPHYVAPEIAARSARSATMASDLYSLGAILYELLAGRPPFEAEGIPALLKKIAEEEPRPFAIYDLRFTNAGQKADSRACHKSQIVNPVPRDLQIICLKCLAKEPARRYASARELGEDLRRWLAGRTILARPATTVERLRSWRRRNPALAALSVALALVLGAAGLLQALANRRLQQTLATSLLAQAELQRSSGRVGQRFETLSLIRRAAGNEPRWFGSAARPGARAALRTEAAAALALPDVRPLSRWPVHISHYENRFDFTANLDRYATATAEGGFAVFSTADHRRLWHMRGVTNNPAVELWLSPDGRWLAVNFQDGHGELHSLGGDHAPRRWPGGRSGRSNFAFASPGNRLAAAVATASGREIVAVIHLESGATEAEIPHRGARMMAFDPAARRLAMAGTELGAWNLGATNQLWSTRLPHDASAVAWSPDGRSLAVAVDRRQGEAKETFKDDPILLYDAQSGQRQSVLAELSTRTASLAYGPDGDWLAAATWQSELLLLALRPDGFRLRTPGAQRALRVAADGGRLAYASTKEELGILQVAVPTVLREWRWDRETAPGSFTMSVSADGRWVAASTRLGVHLWDATTRKHLASLPVPPDTWWVSVLFGPGDEFVYYSGASFGVRRVELVRTNAPDGAVTLQFGSSKAVGEPGGFTATAFAADGRSLIVGQNRRRSVNERIPPTMWLWPDGDPARARKLAGDFPLVGYRALPGGRWGVSTDLIEPDLWVWNFESGERVRSLGIPLPATSELAPDGRWLVTRTRTEFVVWEVGSWRVLARWPVTAAEQLSGWLVASPDSRLLATATLDGRITLRSMPSGVELIALTPPRPMRLSDWRFTPDHRRLYVLPATGHVFEWNLAELRLELAQLGLDW